MKTTPSLFKRFALLMGALLLSACIDSGGGGGGSSGPQTILVIGDSISGSTNYPGTPPWPSLMQGMVPAWTVINRGTSGERIRGGRAKVGDLLRQHQPDSLVIFYGSNNAIFQDTANFEADLAVTIQAGTAAGARVLVCTVPYIYGARRIYNGGVDKVNAAIFSAAAANGAGVVNINAEFGITSSALFPDGLHPNLDGQRIIAAAVRERL